MTKKAKRRHALPPADGITDTFESVEKLLLRIVGRSVRQHKLDYDEVVSAVHWGFMQAVQSYTATRGAFTTWCGYKAKCRVKDLLVQRGLRKNNAEALPEDAACEPTEFSVSEWLDDLSDDARTAAELVLTPPMDVKATVAQHGDRPWVWRQAVREFLADQDWKKTRIASAFREVKQSL